MEKAVAVHAAGDIIDKRRGKSEEMTPKEVFTKWPLWNCGRREKFFEGPQHSIGRNKHCVSGPGEARSRQGKPFSFVRR